MNSKDVAKVAGVSKATVARVFANPELVKEETRKLVLKIAQKMHYVPSSAASALKASKPKSIGLIISDIKNPFFSLIGARLQESLKQRKLDLIIHFSNEDGISEDEAFDSLISSRVNSIVFTPSSYSLNTSKKLNMHQVHGLQLFREAYDNIDSIVIDDAYGTYLAAKELIEYGHRKILLIDGWSNLNTNRSKGYKQAFDEAGIKFDEGFIKSLKLDVNQEDNIAAMIEELNPTAIIPVSELLCSSTAIAIKKMNKKIKDDISLIFYDDSSIAKFLNITVVSHNTDEIIDMVIEMLFNKLDGGAIDHKILNPILLKRDSIKKIV